MPDRITPPPSRQHALHLIEILLRTYVPKNTPDWNAWQTAVAILKAQPAGAATLGAQAYCGRCDRGPAQAPSCPHGTRCGRPDVAGDGGR